MAMEGSGSGTWEDLYKVLGLKGGGEACSGVASDEDIMHAFMTEIMSMPSWRRCTQCAWSNQFQLNLKQYTEVKKISYKSPFISQFIFYTFIETPYKFTIKIITLDQITIILSSNTKINIYLLHTISQDDFFRLNRISAFYSQTINSSPTIKYINNVKGSSSTWKHVTRPSVSSSPFSWISSTYIPLSHYWSKIWLASRTYAVFFKLIDTKFKLER